MRLDMPCERARVELSARLDGETDVPTSEALEQHLVACAPCRAHEVMLARTRRSLRAQPTGPVPDHSGAIMARVTTAARRRELRPQVTIAGIAAAVAALVVLGASLPGSNGPPDAAQAGAISRKVRAAARDLTAYRATFEIVERGWHPAVPVRRFTADVSFRAPESFRLSVRDRTLYPDPVSWPANDVDLVAGPHRWWIREPTSCPTEALPGCAVAASTEQRALVHRQPFDGTGILPTDIIVPLETLASSNDFEILGSRRSLGRTLLRIELPYRRAAPLVSALQVGGSWRAFSPSDRVEIWIDERTWFPLVFEVSSGGSGRSLLRASATAFSEPQSFDPGVFAIPRSGLRKDGGFSSEALFDNASVAPAYLAGLRPYRSGITDRGQRILAYVDGMTWLKVMKQPTGRGSTSNVTDAEEIVAGDGTHLYYQPATTAPTSGSLRRRVDVFTHRVRVHLESNLARAQLLRVAASLDMRGRALPEVQQVGGLELRRLELGDTGGIPWIVEPERLPAGYRGVSAYLSRSRDGRRTVTIHFRHSEADLDGFGIRITQSTPYRVLPPSSETFLPVDIGSVHGRWSDERGELEWIEGGVYRAVAAPSFGLDEAVEIARSLR